MGVYVIAYRPFASFSVAPAVVVFPVGDGRVTATMTALSAAAERAVTITTFTDGVAADHDFSIIIMGGN